MRRRGVTLAEALLVVFVVLAALVPIAGLLVDTGRRVGFNQDRAVAQLLAQQVVERYRGECFGLLADTFPTFEQGSTVIGKDYLLGLLMASVQGNQATLYERFHREARFEERTPGLMGAFHCRVTWTDNQQRDHAYEVSVILRNGVYHHGK